MTNILTPRQAALLQQLNQLRKTRPAGETVQDKMMHVAEIAKAKARIMAQLELTEWNDEHMAALKAEFGFTDATLQARKAELERDAN
jgi:hypothetical protein